MLPTSTSVSVTPGDPLPPALVLFEEFEHPAATSAITVTSPPKVANTPRGLRDIGPPLPCDPSRPPEVAHTVLSRPGALTDADVSLPALTVARARAVRRRRPPPGPAPTDQASDLRRGRG